MGGSCECAFRMCARNAASVLRILEKPRVRAERAGGNRRCTSHGICYREVVGVEVEEKMGCEAWQPPAQRRYHERGQAFQGRGRAGKNALPRGPVKIGSDANGKR